MALVVMIALLTDLRRVAYASLAALLIAGLWPILILLGAFATLLVLGIVIGLAGAADGHETGLSFAGDGLLEGGAILARWYYRLLARVRSSLVWGAGLGAVAGTTLIWALLGFYVIPREQRTLETLLQVRQALERWYSDHGSYPPAGPASAVSETWFPGVSTKSPVVDGFGRPVSYNLKGAWKLASYTVYSLGFDGVPSGDDLCVFGGTGLKIGLSRTISSLRALYDEVGSRPGKSGIAAGLSAVLDSRCGAPSRGAPTANR